MLLQATESLLSKQGRDFGLADVATQAGLSVATAYRHFRGVQQLIETYHLARIEELADNLNLVAKRQRGIDLFREVCACWVETILSHARALKYTRQAEGFLESIKSKEPVTSAIYRSLSGTLKILARDGVIPEQDHDYAILIWITLFDERLLVDLQAAFNYTPQRIASVLGSSVLASLREVAVPIADSRRDSMDMDDLS